MNTSRKKFMRQLSAAGLACCLPRSWAMAVKPPQGQQIKRVGIIGLDTSHSIEFTRLLNDPAAGKRFNYYRVTVAYPFGSRDIAASKAKIEINTTEIKKYGVRLVASIDELLSGSDAVLLETTDGRMHLQQLLPILKTQKPVFVDKPLSASLAGAAELFRAARQHGTPLFSCSALRYMDRVQEIAAGRQGKVIGADVYSPAPIEATYPDLFWYGIHGVEMLLTLMGSGCTAVQCIHTTDTDLVSGRWNDGRIATYRGTRSGPFEYGGIVFTEQSVSALGAFTGYAPLLQRITVFFDTGRPPVSPEETLEIYAFMEAAWQSRLQGGSPVALQTIKI